MACDIGSFYKRFHGASQGGIAAYLRVSRDRYFYTITSNTLEQLARIPYCATVGVMKALGESDGPQIQIVAGDGGTFLSHFWDPETSTEALLFYWPETYGSSPVEQRIWRAQRPMTETDLHHLLLEWDFDPKRPLTDESRRKVPITEMNNAFVSAQSMYLLEQSEDLDLPSEEEVLKVIRLQEQGKIPRSSNPAIRTKRDLRGRWKELRAVQIYIQARVGQRKAAPAQFIRDQLELENSRAANNLIERARQHEYLARSQKKDDLAILPGAYRDASDIRSLVSQSREFD